jgi:hypothetical protein
MPEWRRRATIALISPLVAATRVFGVQSVTFDTNVCGVEGCARFLHGMFDIVQSAMDYSR